MGGREKREESQNTMEVVIEVGRPHEEEEEEESAAVGSIKCNWVQQGKRGGGGMDGR